MTECLIILCAVSVLQSAFALSLMPFYARMIFAFVAAFGLYMSREMAAGTNISALSVFLSERGHLETLSALMIIQSIVALMTGVAFCQRRGEGRKAALILYFPLIPPLLFPAAIFSGMLWCFNNASGFSFSGLALVAALTAFLIVLLLPLFAGLLFNSEEQRFEKLAGLHILQVLGGMFLPVLASGSLGQGRLDSPGADFGSLVILALMLCFIFCAIALNKVIYEVKMRKRFKNGSYN